MEGGRDQLVVRRVRQQIPRELLDREAIKRHVAVDRVDHPVAVLVGRQAGIVLLVAVAVGVARHVEPVPAPPLTEVLGRQKPIGRLLVSLGAGILEEGVEFFGRRRQPDQVERQSPQQCRLVGLARRSDLRRVELREHEGVDRISDPLRPAHFRQFGPADWLVGPVLRPFRVVRRRIVGASRPLVDPRPQQADLRIGELLSVRRHHHVGVGAGDVGDDQTLRALADDDRLARVAQRPVLAIEPQARLLLLLTVALVAMLHEEGPDLLVEVDRLL